MPPNLTGDAELSIRASQPSTQKNEATAPTDVNSPTKIDKQSWNYVLRSGLAGGLAGCAAKTVVGPLDRVKILFQTSNPQFAKYAGSWFGAVTAMRNINRTDGLPGLFRGHSATLIRIFPYAAIKFLAYEQIRSVLIPSAAHETPLRRLLSGSFAGVTSVFVTYPLELIRVRLAFETKQDSRSSLRRIWKKIYFEHSPTPVSSSLPSSSNPPQTGPSPSTTTTPSTLSTITPRSGLANFYRGFAPTLCGMLPYAGMSFLTHDTVGDWLRSSPLLVPYTTLPPSKPPISHTTIDPPPRPKLTNTAELISGALAGLVSQTVSYPLEVIRRRMQVGGAVGDGRRLRMGETTRRIWRERGFRGFWVGLTIGYLKVVPMVAVSFWVYERTKGFLGI